MAKWYVVRGDQERGPFEDAQLKEFAASGKLKPDHQIRRDGSDTARPAKNIKGLFPSKIREQFDNKQIPPPLPDSKATPTKQESETASPPPQPTPSNLGKNIGAVCGILVLFMGGVRGCLQATAVKNKNTPVARQPLPLQQDTPRKDQSVDPDYSRSHPAETEDPAIKGLRSAGNATPQAIENARRLSDAFKNVERKEQERLGLSRSEAEDPVIQRLRSAGNATPQALENARRMRDAFKNVQRKE